MTKRKAETPDRVYTEDEAAEFLRLKIGAMTGVRKRGEIGHSLTCFMFFGHLSTLFWTASGELSDVESQV